MISPPVLTDRVAVVTGGSRGLGRDIARSLARHGAVVAVVGRDPDALADVARVMHDESGRSPLVIEADVTDADRVAAMRALTDERLGPAQILVNAAGRFGPLTPIQSSVPDDWIRTLMVDAVGPYLTCRAYVGGMLRTGWGRIINVSSAAALYPPGRSNSAYSTAKAALNRMTRHLAVEVAGTGVTANVIHPGSLQTAMWADIKAKVEASPGHAGALQDWVELVERTGGDSPDKAIEVVLRLVANEGAATNGEFCWPDGALEPPIASWSD